MMAARSTGSNFEITAMDIPVYSNRIARKVFPGIIKPLIWSVNVPLVIEGIKAKIDALISGTRRARL